MFTPKVSVLFTTLTIVAIAAAAPKGCDKILTDSFKCGNLSSKTQNMISAFADAYIAIQGAAAQADAGLKKEKRSIAEDNIPKDSRLFSVSLMSIEDYTNCKQENLTLAIDAVPKTPKIHVAYTRKNEKSSQVIEGVLEIQGGYTAAEMKTTGFDKLLVEKMEEYMSQEFLSRLGSSLQGLQEEKSVLQAGSETRMLYGRWLEGNGAFMTASDGTESTTYMVHVVELNKEKAEQV